MPLQLMFFHRRLTVIMLDGFLPLGFAIISMPVSARLSGFSSTRSAVSSSVNNALNTRLEIFTHFIKCIKELLVGC